MRGVLVCLALIGSGAAAQQSLAPPPVEDFVKARNFHGMQYESAARYGPEAVEPLRRVLSDPAARDAWGPSVWVLGVIATPEAVEALIEFHEKGIEGVAGPDALQALLLVPQALGFAAHDPDSRAFSYLRDTLRMEEGTRRINWTGEGWEAGSREILLAKLAANGLGLAGNAEGRRVLEQTRAALAESDQERLRFLRPNIAEALEISVRIERLGYARALAQPERDARPRTPAPDER